MAELQPIAGVQTAVPPPADVITTPRLLPILLVTSVGYRVLDITSNLNKERFPFFGNRPGNWNNGTKTFRVSVPVSQLVTQINITFWYSPLLCGAISHKCHCVGEGSSVPVYWGQLMTIMLSPLQSLWVSNHLPTAFPLT